MAPAALIFRPDEVLLLAQGDTHVITSTGYPLEPVSYTHLRAHETVLDLVCRLLLEKKKKIALYIVNIINLLHTYITCNIGSTQ